MHQYMHDLHPALDVKDDKAMVKLMKSTLPQFTNEHDWEMAALELTLVLDRVWPHKQALDISDYLKTSYPHYDRDMAKRADSMIYFALTLAAKKDSFAKLQIMAASHPDAIPCVRQNEGKKLFQMFQSLFTMTIHHTANLPTIRKQFHDVNQTDTETVLDYTSRVDIIVATMAKLGEQVSPGAWIYALGNGLRNEYKDTKDGILYSKAGYDTVLSVKSKILSEEAILKDKRATNAKSLLSQKIIQDEIAMKIAESKLTKTKPTVEQAKPNMDQANFSKGKDGKKATQKDNVNGLVRMNNGLTGNNNPTGINRLRNHGPRPRTIPTGNIHPPKERANHHLERNYGATFIKLMVIPQIGALTIQTNQENHRNRNGVTIIKLMVMPQKRVERVMASHPRSSKKANSHPNIIQVVKSRQKDQTAHGRAITSPQIMTKPHLLYRLPRH
jgi:hypothetical protein